MNNMLLFGEMYARKLILTWARDKPEGWTLASGAWSPFYFMFRHVPFHPDLFDYSVTSLTGLVSSIRQERRVDAIVGVATTGIPLAAGVALRLGVPLAFTRKLAGVSSVSDLTTGTSLWGQHSLLEGAFQSGMHYLLIDDVVTGGASKLLARQQVEAHAKKNNLELVFEGTAVVVDRGFPGLSNSVHQVSSANILYDQADEILRYGGTEKEVKVIKKYLQAPDLFQDSQTRASVIMSAME